MNDKKKFYIFSGSAALIVILFYFYWARNKTVIDNPGASNYPVNQSPTMSAAGLPITMPASSVGSNVYNLGGSGDGSVALPSYNPTSSDCCCGCNGVGGDSGSPLTTLKNFIQGLSPKLVDQYVDTVPTPNDYLTTLISASPNDPMRVPHVGGSGYSINANLIM